MTTNLEIFKELGALRQAYSEMHEDMRGIRREVTELRDYANRAKGAFLFALVIGSFLGWVISSWEKIKHFFNG
jgi:hypothetical protein